MLGPQALPDKQEPLDHQVGRSDLQEALVQQDLQAVQLDQQDLPDRQGRAVPGPQDRREPELQELQAPPDHPEQRVRQDRQAFEGSMATRDQRGRLQQDRLA